MVAGEDTLVRVEEQTDSLILHWSTKQNSRFHYLWLRDNCLCEDCGDPAIGRKSFRIIDLPLDIRPRQVEIDHAGNLAITWDHDGHQSYYEADFLKRHDYAAGARKARRHCPVLWDQRTLQSPPTRRFQEVERDPSALFDLLCQVRDYGICFLTGGPADPKAVERIATAIGPIQESNFGRLQDMQVDPSQRSVAYSGLPLVPHSDEPYRASPPGILLFYCLETCSQGGGQSIFVDGFQAAERLRQEDAEGFAVLTKARQSFRRCFTGDVDLECSFPVIAVDEFGGLTGVRVNDRVAAPLAIEHDLVPIFYRAYKRLLQLSGDPDLTIARRLQPGDLAIFDNHRILHGRTELSLVGRRRLIWCQVERGDFYSRLRVLEDQLDLATRSGTFNRGAYA